MRIRKAKMGDGRNVAKVQVDTWKTTYKGVVPDQVLEKMTYDSREKQWKGIIETQSIYVAETAEGEIVGFSNGGKERSGKYEGYEGELYAIYIRDEHQNKGLGRKLVRPVVEDLLKEGISSMVVLVLRENPACRFYESLGAVEIASVPIKVGSEALEELVYGWKEIGDLH
ncbi:MULTISPECIES: GNAT family N-acetyltransferase [Pontibacillus]|uniref:GNAT family N-acetyltransferase n=1 Tax=Pontibacillus chungwhensis TaxID=265426 RepID=A0ABY8USE0_9BACI|nr:MULTISPECIES: GNAT family N-acetyltransferase [Pontibacillus]MCD5323204.1 GNAT family N-acetyltransferase [Pontibacillus sp. HN14]WIF96591.1 GNAT family N-acetyltransferase [Pontibacillus chungwhensis]